MWKWKRILLLTAALALLFSAAALAEGATNPYAAEARAAASLALAAARPEGALLKADSSEAPLAAAERAMLSVSIDCVQDPASQPQGEWRFSATGGDGAYSYLVTMVDADTWGTDSYTYRTWSSENTFSRTFVIDGSFFLFVQARDSAGITGSAQLWFESGGTGGSIADAVRRVVAQCRAAGCTGEYDTAVWLHDWLTQNNYYDLTYLNYGADAALLGGTGVCDSYSKAYLLLLSEAGVRADRALSTTHAWNIVYMEGKWYHVDVTWDDPLGGASGPVSGRENGMYFGLTDALTRGLSSHGFSISVKCESLDCNYLIRSGECLPWVDESRWTVNNSSAPAFSREAQARLDRLVYAFEMTLPRYYLKGNGTYIVADSGLANIINTVTAYELTRRDWLSYGVAVRLSAAYDAAAGCIRVSAAPDSPVAAIALPTAIETVSAGTLAGCAGKVLVLPASVKTVASGAFADMPNLEAVVFLSVDVTLADDAFRGCAGLRLLCEGVTSSSVLRRCALVNGYTVEYFRAG